MTSTPPNLTNHYSGIVLNQNTLSNELYPWRNSGASWIYQTFTLPSDYPRGVDASELRIPDLSGIQVLVLIDSGMASVAALDYVFEYYAGSKTKWISLTSGTVIGAHADGDAWFDIIFPDLVPVSSEILGGLFRFGIQGRTATGALYAPVEGSDGVYTIGNQVYLATLTDGVPYPITVNAQPAFLLSSNGQVTYSLQQGIDSLRCVMPTPLTQTAVGQGQAYQSDGVTPLLGLPTSLNFRILGLTADNGTNFLNNEYRSCVITASAQNVDTTSSTPITNNTLGYWMSPPQPSRFAVQSLYFDMRPAPVTPTFGLINYAGNPSFEYDEVGAAPEWWLPYSSGGIVIDQTVHDTQITGGNRSPWAYDGERALHMKYSFSATDQRQGIWSDYQPVAAITNGQPTPFTVSVAYNLITASSSKLVFDVTFYDTNQVALPNPAAFSVSSIGSGILSGSGTLPANAAFIRFRISGLSTGAGYFEAYVDAAQFTFTATPEAYFDGDKTNCKWVGQRGQSASAQLTTETIGNSVVIDSVLVDPVTPNLAFNVYYSQDDAYTSTHMSESDWEQKLWVHVPEVFVCTQRQQYVFPAPVPAKYMKVEFTNLQSRPYQPGPLAKPVQYKKFPIWVADYFIAQLALPAFVASSVNVQYDALSFAYDYYLGDLNQEPATPTAPPQSAISQLTSYFNPTTATTGLDPTTLAQINLAMKTFQSPLGTYVDTQSALGSFVSTLLGASTPPVSVEEGGTLTPIDYSTVSSLQREAVVFEQSFPVMYFFVTCRHAYKELAASFDYNRAYFAGVNEIAFLRNNYQVATDTPLYIEPGGDPTNVVFNDWVLDTDQNWYVY